MKTKRSVQRPYGYVFVEGGRVVIRGSGPLGSRLMMAMASGWNDVHCEESSRDGRSTWAIMLNTTQVGSRRQLLERMRSQLGWLTAGVLGCGGAGFLAAKGWWVTAALMACSSVVVWVFGSARR